LSESQENIELQKSSRNDGAIDMLDLPLTAAGYDVDDLQIAIEAVEIAKEQSFN